MNILHIVSGSIAAIKGYQISKGLMKKDINCKVILTEKSQLFSPKLVYISQNIETYTTENEWDEKYKGVLHVDLAKWADALLISPASANIINKIACGINDQDTLPISTFLALDTTKKIFIVPAMNTKMYENPVVQYNIQHLKKLFKENIHFLEPIEKKLACGDVGKGALPNSYDIVDFVCQNMNFN